MKSERPEIDANIEKFIEYKISTYQDETRKAAERTKSISYAKVLSSLEQEYGKPAYLLKKEDIIAFLRKMNYRSVPSFAVVLTFMGQYATWCVANGQVDLDSWTNPFSEIKWKDLQEIYGEVQEDKMLTRESFLVKLDSLNKGRPLNASDKFLLLGIFEGFNGERYSDLTELKWSQIAVTPKGNHYVNIEYNGNTVRKYMSDELYTCARNSYREVIYISLTNTGRYLSVNQDEEFEDHVVKPIMGRQTPDDDKGKTKRAVFRIKNSLRWIGMESYSALDIRRYGKIDFIKKRALKNEMTPYEYVRTQKGQMEFFNQYSDSKLINFYKNFKKYFE